MVTRDTFKNNIQLKSVRSLVNTHTHIPNQTDKVCYFQIILWNISYQLKNRALSLKAMIRDTYTKNGIKKFCE